MVNFKYLRMLFLLLFTSVPWVATMGGNASILEVWTKGGGRITYSLSNHPVATYSGTDLVLTTGYLVVNYPLAELQKFTFGTETDAVKTVQSELDGRMQTQEGMLFLSGFPAGTPVAIYTLDGRTVATTAISPDGTATLSIHALATGIYVVKTGSVTHKIIKK